MPWDLKGGIKGPQGDQGPAGTTSWSGITGKPAVIAAGADQATARTAIGLKSAAVADLVGTVSQSAGTPTGAVMQRGSNANGEWIRFADGTQICWFVLGSSSPVTWTFPATFTAVPVAVFIDQGPNAATDQRITSISTSSTTLVGGFNSKHAMAIGRWF